MEKLNQSVLRIPIGMKNKKKKRRKEKQYTQEKLGLTEAAKELLEAIECNTVMCGAEYMVNVQHIADELDLIERLLSDIADEVGRGE